MKLILTLIVLLLVGCGNGEFNKTIGNKYFVRDWGIYQQLTPYEIPYHISPEMLNYITAYKAEAAKRDVPVNYSDLRSITLRPFLKQRGQELWGYCQIYDEPNGSLVSEIVLSEKLNTEVPAIIKKIIIFHELSHCLLGIQHTPHEQKYVLQIMFWSSGYEQVANVDSYQDPTMWNQYLDFLFKAQNQEQTP